MKKLKPIIFFLSCLGLVVLNNNCQKDKDDFKPEQSDNKKISVLDIPPPGEYVQSSEHPVNTLESFSSEDKLIVTYYFYWYDISTNLHIIDPDGSDALTDHPVNMQNFSYKDVGWHKQELLDMIDAGIDIVLPVYWGNSEELSWAVTGIEKLVEASQILKYEGINAPKIGMFYDTSSLQYESVLKEPEKRPDLTTDFGREYFYKLIRDFFSLVPPDLRARIDGKPYVQLYTVYFAEKHDQSTFDFADQQFSMDFGGNDLYIVQEITWANTSSENLYAWGAALEGINAYGAIAIGPGYDDRAVPGRTTPVRDRENGQFYINNWIKALVYGALDETRNIVNIETWNEFHEGTDIAHSREYGRKYIDITSEYATRFKNGDMPEEDFPGKEFLYADSVFIEFGEKGDTHGMTLTPVELPDGKTTVIMVEDVPCLKPVKTDYGGMYMYFVIDDFFKLGREYPVYIIKVEYYDSENSGFALQYDSKDETATLNGAYKALSGVNTKGTNTWKTVSFEVTDARFRNRQNGRADFRLEAKTTNLYIKRVSVEIINQE